MIDEGKVEISTRNKTDNNSNKARLGLRQFFGEIELINNNPSLAQV